MPRPPQDARDLAGQRLEAARRGDPGAWKELVASYGPMIHAVARRHGLSAADCEEVYQETWVSLFQQLETIRRPASLVAWIARTAQRQSWFVARRRRSASDEQPDSELQSSAPAPDDELESLERAQLVQEALDVLGEPCRNLCRALFFEPETPSYQELAQRLQRSPGSIGPTRLRCLAELAEILERWGVR